MSEHILTLCYLVASVTFIIGLKMLSHPASARRGNLVAASGMSVAIFATIFLYKNNETGERLHNYAWIFGGLLIGAVIGTLAAKKVKMTAMPEMVSLFNGMGGACAALISIVEFNHSFVLEKFEGLLAPHGSGISRIDFPSPIFLLIISLGVIIGSVSFAGSIVAWGKLNGIVKDFSFRGQHVMNLVLLASVIFLAAIVIYKTYQLSFNIDPETISADK